MGRISAVAFAKAAHGTRATFYAGVWRGSEDDDFEAPISDMTHVGRAWVSFLNGGAVDLPTNIRLQTLTAIKKRWPNARMVPVLPSGGEPLADDLRLTPHGYQIAVSAAQDTTSIRLFRPRQADR
jgi:hypothetical protein